MSPPRRYPDRRHAHHADWPHLPFLGAVGYLIDRHPRLAKPVSACGTWAAVLVAAVALVVALR